jgi:uncharacterized SAM-binding protein YcdF (DUF218 family)
MSPYALASFFLMPVPTVILCLLGFAAWRWPRLRRSLIGVGLALLIAASVPGIGKAFVRPLTPFGLGPDDVGQARVAAVLVPTGGIFHDTVATWWASDATVYRLARADALRRRLGVPLVIAGGIVEPGAPAEAWIVAKQYGLAEDPDVILDTTARTTAETAANLKALLKDKTGDTVLVVTSPWHCLRTAAVIHRAGVKVMMAITGDWPWVESGEIFSTWMDLVPSIVGYHYVNKGIAEYAAIAWYLIQGRLRLTDLADACPAPGRA